MSKLVVPDGLTPLDQFPPNDPFEDPINRRIAWGLEPAEFTALFGEAQIDVSFEYRLASLPSKYRYTFSNGSAAVDGLVISDVVVALRLYTLPPPTPVSLLALVVNLDHWSSNRSQQMFPWMGFSLYNNIGQRLTSVQLPQTFVTDCQPNPAWVSNPVRISGAQTEYFRTAFKVEILLPPAYGGGSYDHGPICH